jgi:hypothetical protein
MNCELNADERRSTQITTLSGVIRAYLRLTYFPLLALLKLLQP